MKWKLMLDLDNGYEEATKGIKRNLKGVESIAEERLREYLVFII